MATKPSAKSTFQSGLRAITATFDTVAATLSTVHDGVSIGHRTVSALAEQQLIRQDYSLSLYEEKIAQATKLEQAEALLQNATWQNQSEGHKVAFNLADENVTEAVAKRREMRAQGLIP